MKPMIAIPEPLQFPLKLAGAIVAVIITAIAVYIGAVLSVYVLGLVLDVIYRIF